MSRKKTNNPNLVNNPPNQRTAIDNVWPSLARHCPQSGWMLIEIQGSLQGSWEVRQCPCLSSSKSPWKLRTCQFFQAGSSPGSWKLRNGKVLASSPRRSGSSGQKPPVSIKFPFSKHAKEVPKEVGKFGKSAFLYNFSCAHGTPYPPYGIPGWRKFSA